MSCNPNVSQALPRLGKQLTLVQFDRAAGRLLADGVDLRAFVLVGVPFVPAEEQAQWVAASVRHAAGTGARSVALIPVRGGNGELERLQRLGWFEPPDLALVEESLALGLEAVAAPRRRVSRGSEDPRHMESLALGLEAVADRRAAVQVDPWDLDRVASACGACRASRIEAIREMNRTGEPRRTACDDCGA